MEEKRNESRIPEKKHEKVQLKGLVTRKKSSKFAELFLKEDIQSVQKYVREDVIFPAIKDAILNAVTSGLSMIFFGEVRDKRDRNRSRASHVSYSRYYDDRDYDRRDRDRDRDDDRRKRYDYEDITFDNRGDAIEVINSLIDMINEYKIVSIHDYYDILPEELLDELDIHPEFTDEKYGWTDLRSIHEERAFGGKWRIKMPRAIPLN